jgi:hypothetical protein
MVEHLIYLYRRSVSNWRYVTFTLVATLIGRVKDGSSFGQMFGAVQWGGGIIVRVAVAVGVDGAVGVMVGVKVIVGVGVGVLNQPPRLVSTARKPRA